MKIFCCYTPAHFVLFDRYFRPSLPPSLELEATEILLEGRGDFLSAEFLACIRQKIGRIVESIRAHPGECIIWSDVDIVFVGDPLPDLERITRQSEADLFFQREARRTRDVNTGFILIRCNERSLAFFRAVQESLAIEQSRNEQWIFNQLLAQGGTGCA